MVVLWSAQIQENKVFDDAEDFALNHLQLQPLTLNFDVDAKAIVGPEGTDGCSISSTLTAQNVTAKQLKKKKKLGLF